MVECEACDEIVVGPAVKVEVGTISEDGEFDVQETEWYHPHHVKVDW